MTDRRRIVTVLIELARDVFMSDSPRDVSECACAAGCRNGRRWFSLIADTIQRL